MRLLSAARHEATRQFVTITVGCAARDNGGLPGRLAAASSGVGSPPRWLPTSHFPVGSLPAALYGY